MAAFGHLDSDSGNITEIVPKRRGVGGMTPHIENGLVIGGREIIFESFDRSKSAVFLGPDVTDVAIGFNDFTTDAEGRLWVGSLAFRVFSGEEMRPGHLHVIDLDGSVRTVSNGLLTNGMGFRRTVEHFTTATHVPVLSALTTCLTTPR